MAGYLQVPYGMNSEVIAHAVAESPVPEPSSLLLLTIGIAALAFRRKSIRNVGA